jgi:hypothetical protein
MSATRPCGFLAAYEVGFYRSVGISHWEVAIEQQSGRWFFNRIDQSLLSLTAKVRSASCQVFIANRRRSALWILQLQDALMPSGTGSFRLVGESEFHFY